MKKAILLGLFIFCASIANAQVCSNSVVGSGITCVNQKSHFTASSTTGNVIYTSGYPANSVIVVGTLGTAAWSGGQVSNTAGYIWTFWR